MARTRAPQKTPVPATIPPQRGEALLRQQLDQIDRIEKLKYTDPEIHRWELTTTNMLEEIYGRPDGEMHRNTAEFAHAHGTGLHRNMTAWELQRYHSVQTQRRKAVLESLIEQLGVLAPPVAQLGTEEYRLHPKIDLVSGRLFRDGHFKQAALEAFICVIDEVKSRSGLDLDGDKLMHRAFGCDNQTPVIQFNDLRIGAEVDEQRGFLNLFKGVVGLRNLKAHTNRLFEDPLRAHEYLALASLLLRILEISRVNHVPAR